MNFTINVNKKDTILPNLKQIIISFNNNEQNYKDNNDIDLIIESIYFFLKSSSQDINNGKKMINTLIKVLVKHPFVKLIKNMRKITKLF